MSLVFFLITSISNQNFFIKASFLDSLFVFLHYTHTRARTHTHTHAHTDAHTHAHTNTHTHTHIHTQAPKVCVFSDPSNVCCKCSKTVMFHASSYH